MIFDVNIKQMTGVIWAAEYWII